MKLIIQKADSFKQTNKIIEIPSTEINNDVITYFIKSNETLIIKYSDTGEQFLIKDIQSNVVYDNNSEILVIIQESDLISFNGGSATPEIFTAKEIDGIEKVGIKIQNLLDEDFRRVIVIQAGLTTNQRRYFEYLNNLGVRTNLIGFNAQNGFIAYDSTLAYHFISSTSGGATSINSYGTNQVQINKDEGSTGNNGMAIYDGTANPSASAIMYNLSSAGIYANKGRFIQAQSPDNNQFNKLFCTNGSAYLQSSVGLKLYNTANQFTFADNGLVDRMRIDTSGSKIKVGIGTVNPNANSIIDVVSTTQFSKPFPVMTEAQKLAIPSPQIGGHIYQSDATEGVYVYKSSGWTFAY